MASFMSKALLSQISFDAESSNAHGDQTLKFLLKLTFHSQLKEWFQVLLQLNLTVFLRLTSQLLQLTWKLLYLQLRGSK